MASAPRGTAGPAMDPGEGLTRPSFVCSVPSSVMSSLSPKFSVVIPVRNESGNISSLVQGIQAACIPINTNYEIVVVDDCSDDNTADVVLNLIRDNSSLRLIRHDRNGGQSAAIHSGVLYARGEYICTIDGDGQNPPGEIPKLIMPFLQNNVLSTLGLVAGQRIGRSDTLSKRLGSLLANKIRSWILADGTRDTGCGLKAFPRHVFFELPYFNHMHRFLPALVTRAGYSILHVDVTHRPRDTGKSNYSNLQRALVGIPDLLGVYWLKRRAKIVDAKESY